MISNPDQLNLSNEAQLTAEETLNDEPGVTIKSHTYCKNPRKSLPDHLHRLRSDMNVTGLSVIANDAKTTAIARNVFMLADTEAGVRRVVGYSAIDTARANTHNPQSI
jgi:hypothetical protein